MKVPQLNSYKKGGKNKTINLKAMTERGEKPQRNNLALQFKRQKHAAAESVTKGGQCGSLLGFDVSTCQIIPLLLSALTAVLGGLAWAASQPSMSKSLLQEMTHN